MDNPNEENDSSNSGSDEGTPIGSVEHGTHQSSTTRPRHSPMPEEDERELTSDSAQSERSLPQAGCSQEMSRTSRCSSADVQSEAAGGSRDSVHGGRPATAPPMPKDLMREPFLQTYSDSQIDLAARRLRVIKVTCKRAEAEGLPLDPAAAARTAAAVQKEDLEKRETASAPSTCNPRGHPRGTSAGRESTVTGSERSSWIIAEDMDVASTQSYNPEDDTIPMGWLPRSYVRYCHARSRGWFHRHRLLIIWSIAIVGAVLGFVLLGMLLQHIKRGNQSLGMTSTESEAWTISQPPSGDSDDESQPRKKAFL
ncbi:uncharacterized protein [Dermacentor andersoni]|uniref:uncharacterized protein n=1 Tax=Dermacentor andersoni TaxID=34620 RepID=UPI003B3A18F4